MRIPFAFVALIALAAVAPIAARAQEPDKPPPPPKPVPKLVFEREVYTYPGGVRRDPFRSLAENNASGPLFTELTMTGIIYYATEPSKSMVTLRDLSKKEYRVRRGDVIGNATVQDIGKTRVVFSIQEFGMKHQEVLELKLPRSGD